ncbi:MAG: ArnT family glycosyltransferase [Candidatus Micrarchaeaceae archaeon]
MQTSMTFLFYILSHVFLLFSNNFSRIFFFYYIALLAALVLSLAANAKRISGYFRNVKREYLKYLLIAVLAFVFLEVSFVQNYHLLYNDEYIYMSMAKSMLIDHLFGICSFSTATNCVPGTIGLFHQPGGWSMLLAAAYGIFGINIGVAYSTAFLLGIMSVVLIFFVSYLLFEDERYSLMSSIALASIPLFMSYSRTTIPDISVLCFILLSVLLSLMYLRKRDFRIGISALFATAYLMTLKADGVIILPIILGIALVDRSWSRKSGMKMKKAELVLLVLIFAVAAFPQATFLHFALQHSFGAAVNANQSMISLQNFESNAISNVQFWFGAFDTVQNQGSSYYNFAYHIEFPVTITIFAIIGAAGMLAKGRFREFTALFILFAAIFTFYTAFYAGGVLYSLGDDVRYFLGDFAALSLFSGFGFVYSYDLIKKKLHSRKPGKKRQGANFVMLAALFILFISLPAFQFITIVAQPPSAMAAFAGERANENFLLANYNKIPSNCTVVTFKPPFWYVMGRANIYATWISIPEYSRILSNMSNKCLYFDYGLSCYIGERTGTIYSDTQTECSNIMRNYTMEDVATQNYTGYSWNVTFHIYKIIGRNTTA